MYKSIKIISYLLLNKKLLNQTNFQKADIINYFFTKRKIRAYLEYVRVFQRSKIRERVIQVVRYMFLFRGSMFFQITGNVLNMVRLAFQRSNLSIYYNAYLFLPYSFIALSAKCTIFVVSYLYYFNSLPNFSTLSNQLFLWTSVELFTDPKVDIFTGFIPQNPRIDFFIELCPGFL